ncbi:MAG: tetratricopeptide repeat protein [Thermoanaerobaculia bacterium]
MTDGAFPDRLAQLKSRWEADPTSRIFLQLAEEYRHQGRVREALEVLDRGLKEHPGYLSALVARGRCLLELGEPEAARDVLERVVKQDATQMVANKLLVRAYLDTGDPERARERLDLYSLLNDRDPEIEELRRRLRAMEQPPQVPPTSDRSSPGFQGSRPPAPSDDIFDLGPAAAPAPLRRGGDDLFELDAPARPAPSPAPAPAVEAAETTEAEADDVLFPGLASRESRRRYLNALAAEGLFAFEPEPEAHTELLASEVPAPDVVAPILPLVDGGMWTIPDAEPLIEPEPEAISEPVFAEPEAHEELLPSEVPAPDVVAPILPAMDGAMWTLPEPEPAVEPEPEPPVFEIEERTPWAEEPALLTAEEAPALSADEVAATVTLGQIYLRQGHLAEAARIFRDVLRREPENDAARQGLAQLAAVGAERRPLEARDLLAGYEPGEEGGEAEVRARKAFLLNSYLQRLRRGGEADVS